MRRRTTTTVRRPLVLCYHAVSPTWEHRLSIHPDLVLRHVRTLGRFRQVRVTFDDAFRSAATVFSALRWLNVPIQIFVCTGFARTGGPLTIPELASEDPVDLAELTTMSWEELRSHAAHGVEIGSHTISHAHLASLSDGELRRELSESKEQIEAALGRPCTELAYPYGEHDERVRVLARAAGYERAYGLWARPGDRFALPRLDLYRRHGPGRALLKATPLHRFVS
jgi:peptidoglycan/xylan/chitin deacetylase (PgdA/CDA1 family)